MIQHSLFIAILLLGRAVLPAQHTESSLHPAALVRAAHRSGQTFQAAHDLFSTATSPLSSRTGRAAVLRDEVLLQLDPVAAGRLLRQAPPALALRLELPGGGSAGLELVRVDLYAPGFFLNTEEEPDGTPFSPGLHYRGVLAGEEGSVAAISIFPDEVMGMIATPQAGNFVLGRLRDGSADAPHVLYRETDLIPSIPFECESVDVPGDPGPDPAQHRNTSANPCVKVYLEVDSDLRADLGGVSQAANWVSGLFNQSATLFAMESIDYEISQIFVWAGNSPYSAGSPGSILDDFQAQISSLNGDFGHLLTERSNGGVAAGQAGLCNPNVDSRLCVSDIYTYYSTVPTYSWSVYVITHEMGHLNGSPHTHACSWNGNLTAIDGCAGFTEGGCPLPGNPAMGGTIMSYCHNASVGINFSLGFGPQPGARIRGSANGANCLGLCGQVNPLPGCDTMVQDFPFAENFETGFGAWTNATDDDMDWLRRNTGTPTDFTGPTTGSDGPYFAYIEATGNYFKTAQLLSPCFDLKDKVSAHFDFDAHMWGPSIGTLDLEISADGGGNWSSIWSRSGDQGQGNAWLYESVDLAAYLGDTVQLRFTANATGSQWGDIGLDGLYLDAEDSLPPPPDPCSGILYYAHSANFESGFDGWQNVGGDALDWIRQHENFILPGTLPDTAASRPYFTYVDAGDAGGSYPNKTAYLEGPCFMPAGKTATWFHFDYHMQGSGIGSLALEITTDHGGSWTQLWGRSGPKDKVWVRQSINLAAYSGDTVRLRFKATTGTNPTRNIAVDRLELNIVNPSWNNLSPENDEPRITVYPNPATVLVHIEVMQSEAGRIGIELCDVVGKVVSRDELNGKPGGNLCQVSLEGLSPGIYLVKVQAGQRRVVHRLVVQ